MSLQAGGLTTWTATHKNPDGTAEKFYVVVDVSDQAGNEAVKGDATNEDDFVSFQVDSKDPTVKFMSASGKDLGYEHGGRQAGGGGGLDSDGV